MFSFTKFALEGRLQIKDKWEKVSITPEISGGVSRHPLDLIVRLSKLSYFENVKCRVDPPGLRKYA